MPDGHTTHRRFEFLELLLLCLLILFYFFQSFCPRVFKSLNTIYRRALAFDLLEVEQNVH